MDIKHVPRWPLKINNFFYNNVVKFEILGTLWSMLTIGRTLWSTLTIKESHDLQILTLKGFFLKLKTKFSQVIFLEPINLRVGKWDFIAYENS